MSAKKMTIGIIVGNRGFFPDHLAKSGREERAIADTLRLAGLRVPVLIQATPDDPKKMTIAFRRDSFCGKMSACNNLKQYGIPYSITTLHTESPDSPEFAHDLEWFSAVCRVVNGFRNLRVGAIGARPAAFNTVRYSEKILESQGISIETLDLSEVLGRIGRLKDNDERAQGKLAAIQKYVDSSKVPQLASGTPSALLDWNNNYGSDPDKAVCFHCSNLPKHFFRSVKMDFQEIIAGTVG